MTVRIGRWAAVPLLSMTLAGVAMSAPAGAAVPAATSLPAGAQYVALGDSYSAGYGIMPYSNQPIPACQQSTQDFPRQVAAALGLALTDVTCSGAETANIDQTPQTVFANGETGSAPLQDTALSSSTRVVTLTIGGNDLGFSEIAAECFALSATGPVVGPLPIPTGGSAFQDANCNSFLAATTQSNLTTTVAPAISRVLADIKAKAPNAKVFVVEYPAVAPDAANVPSGGCFRSALGSNGISGPFPTDSYPFTTADVPFLNQIEGALNAAIDSAATAAGATLVSAFAASEAHSPCAATADQWVNGLTILSASLDPPSVTTAPGALHPNATGVTFLTGQVQAAIQAAFPAAAPAPTTTAPTTTAPTTATATPSGSASPRPQLAATGTSAAPALTWTAVALIAAGALLTGAGWRGRRRTGGRRRL